MSCVWKPDVIWMDLQVYLYVFIVLRMIYVYGNDYFLMFCCDMNPSAV